MRNEEFIDLTVLCKIYRIGKSDCLIGDEVTSLDYRSDDQVVESVKRNLNIGEEVNDALISAVHYAGWIDELDNIQLSEEELNRKLIEIYNNLKNAS